MQANEKPRLVMEGTKGEAYHCALCGQLFLLPEDRDPEEAARELLAAFEVHVGEEHAREAKD